MESEEVKCYVRPTDDDNDEVALLGINLCWLKTAAMQPWFSFTSGTWVTQARTPGNTSAVARAKGRENKTWWCESIRTLQQLWGGEVGNWIWSGERGWEIQCANRMMSKSGISEIYGFKV